MTNQKNDCCQKNATKLCEFLIKLTPGDFPLAVAETCLGEMVEKTKNSSKEKLWYCKVYMISCSTMISNAEGSLCL